MCFQGVTELLDHRIGEDLASDAFDLLAGTRFIQPIDRNLEVLALAYIGHRLKAHLAECAMNGFALRVEHRLLERHVHVGFHE